MGGAEMEGLIQCDVDLHRPKKSTRNEKENFPSGRSNDQQTSTITRQKSVPSFPQYPQTPQQAHLEGSDSGSLRLLQSVLGLNMSQDLTHVGLQDHPSRTDLLQDVVDSIHVKYEV